MKIRDWLVYPGLPLFLLFCVLSLPIYEFYCIVNDVREERNKEIDLYDYRDLNSEVGKNLSLEDFKSAMEDGKITNAEKRDLKEKIRNKKAEDDAKASEEELKKFKSSLDL